MQFDMVQKAINGPLYLTFSMSVCAMHHVGGVYELISGLLPEFLLRISENDAAPENRNLFKLMNLRG